MSYSRRQLYALGEPLGDSATCAKPGGGYVCGGGGSSKSSQATTNNDNRVAVQDGFGFSASNGNSIHTSTTYNVTDGDIVSRGLDTVDKTVKSALDAVNLSGATNADGFSKLLDIAGDMFNTSQGLIGQTQKSVADAYAQAEADKAGTIDNRTIMVIAVAGAAALAYANRGK